MTLHDILCAYEKKDQSEIGGMVGRARYLVSAVNHGRYLLPIQLVEEKSISPSLILYHKRYTVVNMHHAQNAGGGFV